MLKLKTKNNNSKIKSIRRNVILIPTLRREKDPVREWNMAGGNPKGILRGNLRMTMMGLLRHRIPRNDRERDSSTSPRHSGTQNDGTQNTKYKILNTIFLVVIFTFSFLVFSFRVANATTMKSDSYQIQWGTINIGGGKTGEGSDNYRLGISLGEMAPGISSGSGYLVRSGFQYIHSIVPFSFRISDLAIDFGSLTPGTASTDTNQLTVTAGSAGGFQVLAYENHRLQTEGSNYINDTSCDSSTCTRTQAQVWNQGTTYGFGFNMNGGHVSDDFSGPTYFRPFSDFSVYGDGAEIMASTEATRSATATVTYKVNVNAAQAAGDYQNGIVFIAVPRY